MGEEQDIRRMRAKQIQRPGSTCAGYLYVGRHGIFNISRFVQLLNNNLFNCIAFGSFLDAVGIFFCMASCKQDSFR